MLQSIYTGYTGLSVQQQRLDTVAHNLANINTVGFKSMRTDFKDALYSQMASPIADNDANLLRGMGTLVSDTVRDLRNGAITTTSSNLDVCIEGNGFFNVMTPTGQTVYTRNGAFVVSQEADGNYLTTQNGSYVLDVNGNKITIQGDSQNLAINSKGYLSMGENGQPFARLAISNFANLDGLEAVGNSSFIPTVNSGPAVPADNYSLHQSALESSNVDIALEMTRMIRTQRALQLASRAITTADNMEGVTLGLRQ